MDNPAVLLADEDRTALEDWRNFLEALGPEPWRQGRKVGRTIYRQLCAEPADGDQLIGVMDDESDAEFVAFARNNMPKLIADVLALHAEVERLRGDAVALTACAVCGSAEDIRSPLVVRPFLVCSDHEYP